MKRWVSFLFSLCACAAIVLSAAQDDGLPEGKGKESVLKMCGNCHGLDRITSEKNSRRRWADLVDDMVSRGAEGSDDEVSAVVSYLTRNFGKPVNINTASAKDLMNGLSFSEAESNTLIQYRSDHGAFKNYDELTKVAGLNAKLLEEQKKNILF